MICNHVAKERILNKVLCLRLATDVSRFQTVGLSISYFIQFAIHFYGSITDGTGCFTRFAMPVIYVFGSITDVKHTD